MIRRQTILLIALLIMGCDNSTEPTDCFGIAGGTAVVDGCGVCGGDGEVCSVAWVVAQASIATAYEGSIIIPRIFWTEGYKPSVTDTSYYCNSPLQ